MADVNITTALEGAQQVQQGLGQINKSVSGLQPASAKATTGFRNFAVGVGSVQRRIDTAISRLFTLRTAIIGVVGGQAVRTLVNYASEWQNTTVRIGQFTSSAAEATRVQDLLFASAQRTGTEFATTAEVFARFSPVVGELGLTAEDTVEFVDTLNKVIALSGATSAEASNALRQLSQGFATGTVRGDELRSVMEQFPGLLRIIAQETGQTTAELIASARENGIAATTILRAVSENREEINRSFEELGSTISRSSTAVRNAFVRIIGQAGEASGAVQALTDVLTDLVNLLSSPTALNAITTFFRAFIDEATSATDAVRSYGRAWQQIIAGDLAAAQETMQGLASRFLENDVRVKALVQLYKFLTGTTTELNLRTTELARNMFEVHRGVVQTSGGVDDLADSAGDAAEELAKMSATAQQALNAVTSGGDSVLQNLNRQVHLIQLSARERAIEVEVNKALNQAITDRIPLTEHELEQIRRRAGQLHDLQNVIEETATAEQDAWTKTVQAVTDVTLRWSALVTDIHRSFQGLFQNLGRQLIGLVEGARTATEIIKEFFIQLADAVLAEFARIAASYVFRVLFGTGGPGVGPAAGQGPGGALGGAGTIASGGLIGGASIAASGGALSGVLGTTIVPGAVEAGTGAIAGGLSLGGALASGGIGLISGNILREIVGSEVAASIGGAVSGAIAGLAIGGPIGGIIGGLGGILGGGFFGLFQHGGQFVANRPGFIGVGEAGPELVSVTPLGGPRRGGGGGITVVLQGPTVLDELSMLKFERRLARAVGVQQGRVV